MKRVSSRGASGGVSSPNICLVSFLFLLCDGEEGGGEKKRRKNPPVHKQATVQRSGNGGGGREKKSAPEKYDCNVNELKSLLSD